MPSQNAQRAARSGSPRRTRSVRPLPGLLALVVAADEVGGDGQPLEVVDLRRRRGEQGGASPQARRSNASRPRCNLATRPILAHRTLAMTVLTALAGADAHQ